MSTTTTEFGISKKPFDMPQWPYVYDTVQKIWSPFFHTGQYFLKNLAHLLVLQGILKGQESKIGALLAQKRVVEGLRTLKCRIYHNTKNKKMGSKTQFSHFFLLASKAL